MRLLTKTALALASALSIGSVAASPTHTLNIEFESPALARNFNGGNTFTESGFKMTAVDPNGSGFVGAGMSNSTCAYEVCPSRSSSYYGVLNDGSLKMEAGSGATLRLAGFDAGFISPAVDDSLKGLIGELRVMGVSAAGTEVASFDLQGLFADGTSAFAQFSFSDAFSSLAFTNITFTACLYDFDGSCNPGASFNLAQFGIDSIEVIPEPTSYALVGLALIAAGGVTRRRRSI